MRRAELEKELERIEHLRHRFEWLADTCRVTGARANTLNQAYATLWTMSAIYNYILHPSDEPAPEAKEAGLISIPEFLFKCEEELNRANEEAASLTAHTHPLTGDQYGYEESN